MTYFLWVFAIFYFRFGLLVMMMQHDRIIPGFQRAPRTLTSSPLSSYVHLLYQNLLQREGSEELLPCLDQKLGLNPWSLSHPGLNVPTRAELMSGSPDIRLFTFFPDLRDGWWGTEKLWQRNGAMYIKLKHWKQLSGLIVFPSSLLSLTL